MINPFAINFGMVPYQYIERSHIVDEIIYSIKSEPAQNHCFMLTGIRGSGKTVTMTAIEKEIKKSEDWIVIDLSPERDMLQSLVAKLYDSNGYLNKFLSANVNLSAFGIGVSIAGRPPVADIESALEIILKEIKRKNKKLLITVDEVSNSVYARQFASSFQIMLRQGYPIFLIMAGLYDNIHNLENENTLTFLYRTPKYEMEPLNITLIKQQYKKIFDLSDDKAMEAAIITKGYPFAYQVLGKYLWDSEVKEVTEDVLARFDAAMSQYVYEKIWSELSEKDRWYLSFLSNRTNISVSELLEITKKKKSEFSQYRSRLKNKGIIDVSTRGQIKLVLPRFDEFIRIRLLLDEK